jgi:hypothetical protein
MEYPGNSKHGGSPERAGNERPEIEKIVSGPVTQRKRSYTTRIREAFIGGAGGKGLVQNIFEEVILPNSKSLLVESGSSLLEQAVFGRDGGNYAQRAALRQVTTGVTQVAYNRIAGTPSGSTSIRQSRVDPRPTISQEARRHHNFNEILLATRPEAVEVIRRMQDLIRHYDTVSVAELYKMLGEPSEFTDESWGWENLDHANVHRDARRGGYVLVLPRPEPLA